MPKLADDDPRKWEYTEHTRAKHEILARYLGAWYAILGGGRHHSRLIVLDGFAGRGRYKSGEPGSPVHIHDAAVRAVERGIASRISIRCSEAHTANHAELESVVDPLRLRHDKVEIRTRNEQFSIGAARLAEWLAKQRPTIPTFVFADPFGFTGVSLDVIRDLLAIDRVEVLLTFMARDMSRFLTLPTVEETLTEFFGDDRWRGCTDSGDEERTECLLLRYREAVQPTIARFATPFRVFEDERRVTLYYLVHLTNHPLGMRRMKEAMVAQSEDMTFWPITVRPKDQLRFDVNEAAPYPSLQKHLQERFSGRRLTFEEILNEDYPDGVWVEKRYRAAIVALDNDEAQPVAIGRSRTTKSGRAPRGLKIEDTVSFGTLT